MPNLLQLLPLLSTLAISTSGASNAPSIDALSVPQVVQKSSGLMICPRKINSKEDFSKEDLLKTLKEGETFSFTLSINNSENPKEITKTTFSWKPTLEQKKIMIESFNNFSLSKKWASPMLYDIKAPVSEIKRIKPATSISQDSKKVAPVITSKVAKMPTSISKPVSSTSVTQVAKMPTSISKPVSSTRATQAAKELDLKMQNELMLFSKSPYQNTPISKPVSSASATQIAKPIASQALVHVDKMQKQIVPFNGSANQKVKLEQQIQNKNVTKEMAIVKPFNQADAMKWKLNQQEQQLKEQKQDLKNHKKELSIAKDSKKIDFETKNKQINENLKHFKIAKRSNVLKLNQLKKQQKEIKELLEQWTSNSSKENIKSFKQLYWSVIRHGAKILGKERYLNKRANIWNTKLRNLKAQIDSQVEIENYFNDKILELTKESQKLLKENQIINNNIKLEKLRLKDKERIDFLKNKLEFKKLNKEYIDVNNSIKK